MARKHTDITRHALARIHGLRTTVVFGAALLVICFQRPLGIGAEGIATLRWLVCASILLDLPITRFYFTARGSLGPRRKANHLQDVGRCSARAREHDDTVYAR